MAVRIALQCSEADAHLILSKDNTAARLLSRPGEAIYNDANGLVEGNNPFQVVWLSDEKREQAARTSSASGPASRWPRAAGLRGQRAGRHREQPRAGEAARRRPRRRRSPAAWLGDAVAIKDPTAAVFRPQGGANLLLIGQNEDAARRCSSPRRSVWPRSSRPPARQLHRARRHAGRRGRRGLPARSSRRSCPARPRRSRSGMPAALAELAAEIDRRQKGERPTASPRFLFVYGLHRFRELRKAGRRLRLRPPRARASASPGRAVRHDPPRRPAGGRSRRSRGATR